MTGVEKNSKLEDRLEENPSMWQVYWKDVKYERINKRYKDRMHLKGVPEEGNTENRGEQNIMR